jgi:FkbM family methyltransferase
VTLSRRAYIDQPSPIQADLLALFDRASRLVIFDVGSCEGEDSIRYARLFPSASIYAVEPLIANIRLIHANLRRYACPGVRVVEKAFSDAPGRARFYVSSGRPPGIPSTVDWDYGNKSSSLLPPDQHLIVHPWVRFDEVVEVETETLAQFCASENIHGIDLLHLDVQGAELKILTGAGAMLDRTKVVWLEVERIPLYRGQPLADEVELFMTEHGFTKARQRVDLVSGDQLYLNAALVGGYPLTRRLRGRLRSMWRSAAARAAAE